MEEGGLGVYFDADNRLRICYWRAAIQGHSVALGSLGENHLMNLQRVLRGGSRARVGSFYAPVALLSVQEELHRRSIDAVLPDQLDPIPHTRTLLGDILLAPNFDPLDVDAFDVLITLGDMGRWERRVADEVRSAMYTLKDVTEFFGADVVHLRSDEGAH